MREKATLKKWMPLQPISCDAIKEELEKMALNGWKLKSVKMRYEFERIEPQKLTYTVDFFPQVSVYNTRSAAELRDYIGYCKEAGWELVDVVGTMHIFVSENEDPIPICTDERLKLEAIKKSIFKTRWETGIVTPLFFMLCILQCSYNFIYLIKSNFKLFTVAIGVIGILYCLSDFLFYLCWKIKNTKRVKNGEKIKYFKLKTAKRIVFFKRLCLLLY